jgi:Holliday junction resolvase RusA-like endonuclease
VKPLSTNEVYGKHWAVTRRLVKPFKDAVFLQARGGRIPLLERFTVVLHYAPTKKRDAQRDLDNLHATLKPCVDALKKAGVVVDDNAARYTPSAPIIHEPTGKPGRLWLVVTDLTPASTETEARHGG